MEILDKTAAMVISAMFNTREHVDSGRLVDNKTSRAFK